MKVLSIIFNDEHGMEIVNPLKAELPAENENVFVTAHTLPSGEVRTYFIPLTAIRCITLTERSEVEG